MIVHGYSMDIYCDGDSPWHANNSMQTVGGKNEADCRRQLKAAGWLLGKDRQLCPGCAKREKVAQEEQARLDNRRKSAQKPNVGIVGSKLPM